MLCPAPAGGQPGADIRRAFPNSSALNHLQDSCDDSGGNSVEAIGLSDIVFDPTNMDAMVLHLEDLRTRHRDLDMAIEQLKADGGDDIRIMGLKREKLRLKDRISWLSSKVTPDIIA